MKEQKRDRVCVRERERERERERKGECVKYRKKDGLIVQNEKDCARERDKRGK